MIHVTNEARKKKSVIYVINLKCRWGIPLTIMKFSYTVNEYQKSIPCLGQMRHLTITVRKLN